jgi:hypothetical protein
MSALSQPQYIGDWLKFEEDNRFCRDVVTVLVSADLPSGQVLGVESTFSKYAPYDNSNPSAASAILIEPQVTEDAKTVTSITDATNTATVVFPDPHGLAVGDIIKVSGATVDTDLNGNYAVATVASATSITFTTANVTDAAYTETTLRITKLNHEAAVIVRGPAQINPAGLNWGTSDGTGVTAGLADLKALNIIALEAA